MVTHNKLWCFGDSFTAGDGCIRSPKQNPYSPITLSYRKYLNKQDGEEILIYPDYVSNHFNLELINTARGGASNEMIFDSVFTHIKDIKKDDYIIIGISYFERFDILINDLLQPTNIGSISTTPDDVFEIHGLSKSGLLGVILNRNNKVFKDRLIRQIKAIKYLLNSVCDNVCIWTHDNDLIEVDDENTFLMPVKYTKFSSFMYDNKMALAQETNGEVPDGHFGAPGHKLWADYIIKHFEDGTK
jgi:hypothetical protein